MGETTAAADDPGGAGPPGETSWQRIRRWRQQRADLDRAIARDTPKAVAEGKAAGVSVAELAELWGVTAAWIYTVAPARPRKGDSSDQR